MQNNILNISNLTELPAAAKELLNLFPDKKIFAFFGEMGVGKTTFIKVICEQLGVIDTVSSPTFSIVNEYKSAEGEKIFHFDFYRIKNINEVYDMGYEDYFFSNSYCFIEWSENIEELLSMDFVKVELTKKGDTRTVNVIMNYEL